VTEHTQTRTSHTATFTRGATVTRYATEHTGMSARVDAGRRAANQAVQALRHGWEAVAETVNPAGWLLLAIAAVGAVVGVAWGWTEAWVAAVGALLLLLLCIPFLLGRHSYAVALQFEKDRVVAGAEVVADLSISNVGHRVALPAVLDIPVGQGLVETHLPLLRAQGHHHEQLRVAAAKRGIITVGPMTIGRGDPLGVLKRDHTWPEVQYIYVHPQTVPLPTTSAGLLRDLEGATTKTIVDSDLSFHAIRDYVPGDSFRHVHWKSTAKLGTLQVRQYEETRRSRIAVALDLDSTMYATEDEFEMAVSCASSIGVQAARDGRELVVTASGSVPRHARGSMFSLQSLPTLSPRALLDGMSGLEWSEDVMALEQVARMTTQESPQLSIVFLVTGSQVDLAHLRRAAISFPSDVSVFAVRCAAGSEPTVRTARELTLLTVGMLHDLGHMMLRGL